MLVAPTIFTYARNQIFDMSEITIVENNIVVYNYPKLEPDILGLIKPLTAQVNIGKIRISKCGVLVLVR